MSKPGADTVHALRLAAREAVEIAKREAGVYTSALEKELAAMSGRSEQLEAQLREANARVLALTDTPNQYLDELRKARVSACSVCF